MVSHKKQELAAKSAAPKDRPRRGRPTGQNRKPLSREEKRARNAQYERERREETAAAMNELADAIGGDRNMSNQDVLASAVSYIQQRTGEGSASTADLVQQNAIFEAEILQLSELLGLESEAVQRLADQVPVEEPMSVEEPIPVEEPVPVEEPIPVEEPLLPPELLEELLLNESEMNEIWGALEPLFENILPPAT